MLTDISSKSPEIPPRTAWRGSVAIFPMRSNFADYKVSLREIERDYRIQFSLDTDCVYNTVWSQDLDSIRRYSDPLRKLKDETGLERELLAVWEASYATIYTETSDTIKNYIQTAKSRGRHTPTPPILRSFHVCDNRSIIYRNMVGLTRKLARIAKTPIDWRWLGSYGATEVPPEMVASGMQHSNWTTSITDKCDMSVENMRAWRNRIQMEIGSPDIIISTNPDSLGSMVFALTTSAPGGSALLTLLKARNANVASMVHLFRQSYLRTVIYHSTATDSVWLCGVDYLNNLTEKHKSMLFDFVAAGGSGNSALFTAQYMQSASFLDTVDFLVAAEHEIHDRRISFYEKALSVAEDAASAPVSMLDGAEEYVSQQYPEGSAAWEKRTQFDRTI